MAIPDLLRGCPLFYELYDEEMERLVKYCNVFTFEPGTTIIKDGSEGQEILILLSGTAWVEKATSAGIVRVTTINQGDVFGELVLVDERVRSADVVAETACYVLEIKYESIFELFKKEPKIFGLIMLNVSRLLAKRLRNSNQIIQQLKQQSAENSEKSQLLYWSPAQKKVKP